jgi:acyl carrier protein
MTESDIRNAIFAALRQIAPEADPGSLRGDQKIRETLELDSFDYLSFLIALHEQLNIEIPEADYGKLTTLDELVQYLMGRADAQGKPH